MPLAASSWAGKGFWIFETQIPQMEMDYTESEPTNKLVGYFRMSLTGQKMAFMGGILDFG